mmetsp:Transcript_1694/g.3757  ORF Transcript_1694/g.3757 Transcript_1694/m.3757 type:complete len:252 (-) Transcript_1694:13-768(-)
MHVVHGELFECSSLGQDLGPLLGFLKGFHFGCRRARKVITSEQGGIFHSDTHLGMKIRPCRLLQVLDVLENFGLFVGVLVVHNGRSGGTVEIVAAKGCGNGFHWLLGVEEGLGEVFEGAAVGENAEALGEKFVEFFVDVLLLVLALTIPRILIVIIVTFFIERRNALDLIRKDNGITTTTHVDKNRRLLSPGSSTHINVRSRDGINIVSFTSTCNVLVNVSASGRIRSNIPHFLDWLLIALGLLLTFDFFL